MLTGKVLLKPARRQSLVRYQQGEGATETTTITMTIKWFENKKRMTMKEKRYSFFADLQERKAESRYTFGTLPFARHTSQRFAKVKEPNLADV